MKKGASVLVTGGAGYVGAVLAPKLLAAGYRVKVLDLLIYGEEPLAPLNKSSGFTLVRGDIRDQALLGRELRDVDAVIHLACISNDPSYELDPVLGKSINFDAFGPLVRIAKENGVQRFIFASSSSVYGVKGESEVTEELALDPLTDYSRYKALCEKALFDEAGESMTAVAFRPATVCGYSPRLRLDLTVNILTNHAVNRGEISVFGGTQKRPNIHIDDMTDLYVQALGWPASTLHRQIYNVGYENHTIEALAEIVRREIGGEVRIKTVASDDLRSYHISSVKIADQLGFRPRRSIHEAVRDLKRAFAEGLIPDSLSDSRYFNIKRMQELALK